MAIATHGTMAVDWENRIDFDRLRRERLDRVKAKLAASEMGALLCFDMTNVRYITATHIGTWAQDKVARWTLLPRGGEPILWDFGSAARHHSLYAPWMGGDERSRERHVSRGKLLPRDRLAGLSMPAVVAWGGLDNVLPARQAESLPAHYSVRLFPDLGHMLPEEAPDEMLDIIRHTAGLVR